jgi:hypothetical protein
MRVTFQEYENEEILGQKGPHPIPPNEARLHCTKVQHSDAGFQSLWQGGDTRKADQTVFSGAIAF